MDLEKYCDNKAQKVNETLAMLLKAPEDNNSVLYDAMNYSIFAGGKRLRPIMFLSVL